MEALLNEFGFWPLIGTAVIVSLFIYGFTSKGSNSRSSSSSSSFSNSSSSSPDEGRSGSE